MPRYVVRLTYKSMSVPDPTKRVGYISATGSDPTDIQNAKIYSKRNKLPHWILAYCDSWEWVPVKIEVEGNTP